MSDAEVLMRRMPLLLALAVALSACASAPRAAWSEQRLCWIERPAEPAPSAELWLAFLLRGFDPRTRLATAPPIDCVGNQVTWDAPGLACVDNSLARTLLPGRPLADEDVSVSQVAGGASLVWVMTNRYASGEALGPVALVTTRKHETVVNALGVLRAFAVRPRLRLEKLGGVELLVAEGESCGTAGGAAGTCDRAMRIMSLRGDRFVPEQILSDRGVCDSPGFLWLQREESERLESGWRRRHELTSAVEFRPESIAVQELLVVRDSDPRHPTTPGRVFRRAEDQLSIAWQNGRLATSGSSLWTRMRERQGP
jgi:hypothetical protein